jgi:hypothetical protein
MGFISFHPHTLAPTFPYFNQTHSKSLSNGWVEKITENKWMNDVLLNIGINWINFEKRILFEEINGWRINATSWEWYVNVETFYVA